MHYTHLLKSHIIMAFFQLILLQWHFKSDLNIMQKKTFVAINFHTKRKVETSRDLIFILINVSLTVNYNVNFQLRGNKLWLQFKTLFMPILIKGLFISIGYNSEIVKQCYNIKAKNFSEGWFSSLHRINFNGWVLNHKNIASNATISAIYTYTDFHNIAYIEHVLLSDLLRFCANI